MNSLVVNGRSFQITDLDRLLGGKLSSLPYALRILAENLARRDASGAALIGLLARDNAEILFRPTRLILQDMLGLPLLVDIMAMQSAVSEAGGDISRIDMSLPVDLVIDHSMAIEYWAEQDAFRKNAAREFELNKERFAFLKACEARFPNLSIIPPGGGIIHQLNLEYLGRCVEVLQSGAGPILAPDICLGTDSHTTMINGLGVLGWGIGGLEAEAIMFGEPASLNVPKVVGLEIHGTRSHKLTATDVALTVTEQLRALGVVDCFVELFGPGYAQLSVPDRATIANMAPEYGATCVYCPIDDNTLRYLQDTGREGFQIAMVEAYMKRQNLWATGRRRQIEYDSVVSLDLNVIKRSVAGPSRPEQRLDLETAASALCHEDETKFSPRFPVAGRDYTLGDGDVIIAAITSCTNTSNPENMLVAGLVAKKAVEKGLRSRPHVKTSLAPGSRVVSRYLAASGLQKYLDELGFQLASFSCSTCNGMSGPLDVQHKATIEEHDLQCVAVLSGNRNFPGRIHPLAGRNVLASPPLVVAYALAGSILVDLSQDPLGIGRDGEPVTLQDIWPEPEEVAGLLATALSANDFRAVYCNIRDVSQAWGCLPVETGDYRWCSSTNITWPGYLSEIPAEPPFVLESKDLRPLVILGDAITTDHISPSGSIPVNSAAGTFLVANGVASTDLNAYGTRRGSSDIVVRSTFANPRLRNEMVAGKEGSWTRLMPENHELPIFDAIQIYRERQQKLIVIAGRNYGCGSSRDTAAKAPWLAGIRAVLAESFERIHRSNLVNMGIVPLQFFDGMTRKTLAIDGSERFDILFDETLQQATLVIYRANGRMERVPVEARFYSDRERQTFRQGGLLPRVFREFISQ